MRCDSAAIVPNSSELLPEPETPVNTVSRRFGISTLTSLRLFTRAPCTRIRSWLSATCSAGDCVSVLVALLIVSPSVGRGRLRGHRERRLVVDAVGGSVGGDGAGSGVQELGSAHRFLHERADPCLFGGSQLRQREG